MFECFLKYSDTNFIGVIDTNNGIYLMSSKFGGDLTLIQLKVYQLLTWLSSKVLLRLLHAHGSIKLVNKFSIYGLVECTWDVS